MPCVKGTGLGDVRRRQDKERYVEGVENGYTKICLYCGIGHGCKPELIGKERWLEISNCPTCREKPFVQRKRFGEKLPA